MIGRKKEIDSLLSYVGSERSEFVAVYGRRRVGKTYLVSETLGKDLFFYVTGLHKRPMKEQLANFAGQLVKSGWKGDAPKDWNEAFSSLADLMQSSPLKRKVAFIDEMPWMDTQRSGFLSALEHFWNSWAARRNDIVLIACGSATTWMTNKLINNKGGLHNRLTHQIYVRPFTLLETEQMLQSKGIHWIREQVAQCYMVMGGIPYYLSLLKSNLSLAQNVDELFFTQGGEMETEFDRLFSSLFDSPDYYTKIVAALAKKSQGMTRDEIAKATRISDGGTLSKALDDLDRCCFIRRYNDIVCRKRDGLYQLTDPFTLFYYHFMASGEFHNASSPWMGLQGQPRFNTWAGYAFETLCLLHVPQIKQGIGIAAVSTNVFSWRSNREGRGTQIDMLIDRQDNVVNVCEMKFHASPFAITKAYRDKLQERMAILRDAMSALRPHKSLCLTFITSNGLKENAYSVDVVSQLTIDDLFT